MTLHEDEKSMLVTQKKIQCGSSVVREATMKEWERFIPGLVGLYASF